MFSILTKGLSVFLALPDRFELYAVLCCHGGCWHNPVSNYSLIMLQTESQITQINCVTVFKECKKLFPAESFELWFMWKRSVGRHIENMDWSKKTLIVIIQAVWLNHWSWWSSFIYTLFIWWTLNNVFIQKIATSIQRLLQFLLLCFSAIVLNAVVTPWFLIPAVPTCIVYFVTQRFYRCSSRLVTSYRNWGTKHMNSAHNASGICLRVAAVTLAIFTEVFVIFLSLIDRCEIGNKLE